jgi:hypothetical protein
VGLSTSYNLIKSLGGGIHIQSEAQVGTEVIFSAICRETACAISMIELKSELNQSMQSSPMKKQSGLTRLDFRTVSEKSGQAEINVPS